MSPGDWGALVKKDEPYLEAVGKIECFWSAHDYTAFFTLYIRRDQARNNASLVRGTSVGTLAWVRGKSVGNLLHESGYTIVVLTHGRGTEHDPFNLRLTLQHFTSITLSGIHSTRWSHADEVTAVGAASYNIKNKYPITIIIWRFGN